MTGARGLAFAAVVFFGAFLLFSLELIFAKLLLPRFGGAAYVWTGSMMAFQGLLFLGYLYAQRALRAPYGAAHLLVLALPLACFPLAARHVSASSPLASLLGSLLVSVGLPFLALSTTSTVLQAWRARRAPGDEANMHSLYAASNAGSLAALIGYPLLIEPRLAVPRQLWGWQALYVLFAALHWACLPPRAASAEAAPAPARPPFRDQLSWLLLSAGPSAGLLAATNLLSLDFAAVPLLWTIPLSLYLSTFILTFKARPWYPRRLSSLVAAAMLAWLAAVVVTVLSSPDFSDGFQLIRRLWVVNKFLFVCASLFIVCLIAHRALAQSRPDAARAPRFYALIALGGWLGSALVAVVMPVVARRVAMPELDWALAGALTLGALLFKDWPGAPRASGEAPPPRAALAALAALGAAGMGFYVLRSPAFSAATVVSLRNFYGFYRVVDDGGYRKFFHGNTLHGLQSLEPSRRREPMLYFSRSAPIGEVFGHFGAGFKRVAVVGLGSGILAAYGRPGQRVDFYELDPDVATIAREHFTFIADSAATVSVIPGDARLSLERAPGGYDLIVLDAFTGGSIPVHTLTREAFALYERKLAPGGLVAVHVTNRFLDLRKPLAAVARAQELDAVGRMTTQKTLKEDHYYSSWVVIGRDRAKIERLLRSGWDDLSTQPASRPWTDQYASLLAALKS